MRRPAVVIAVVALALSLAAHGSAAGPTVPTVFTGAASDVTTHSATLQATVNPNGDATTSHFEYGPTQAYGATTPEQAAGAGTAVVATAAALTALEHSTIYHYRVVAANGAGVAHGYDQTMRTREPPQVPAVDTAGVGQLTPTSASFTGLLDPHDAPTTFHFEYGLTSAYGSDTPPVPVTGYGKRVIAQTVSGLTPFTVYHYRLIATNPTGTSRGTDHVATTLRSPTSIAVRRTTREPAIWAGEVRLTGRVEGQGIGGMTLVVERDDYPFDGRYREAKRFTAGTDGSFKATVGPLWSAVRLRVVTRTDLDVKSPVLEVANRVRVGIIRDGATTIGFGLRGSIRPEQPRARVSVQRQQPSGRWRTIARTTAEPLRGNRSRYQVQVPRPMRSAALRVVVLPTDGGAHVRGFSRVLKISGQL